MKVILLRHADAGSRDAARWPNDDERPVSPEGRVKQAACARAMKKMGIRFDVLVSSPLLRARETADIVADVFGYQDEILTDDALGHRCSAAAITGLLARHAPGSRVLLVGHEPTFSLAAGAFIGRSGDAGLVLKKSGVIGLTFDGIPAPGAGALEYLLKPKHLLRR